MRRPTWFPALCAAHLLLLGCITPTEVDVTNDPSYSRGLSAGTVYYLCADAFLRRYEGRSSLEPPNSLYAAFPIDEFLSGRARDRYVSAVVPAGTSLVLRRIAVRNYQTHTVTLYTAEITTGKHRGESVLINSLIRDPDARLLEQSTSER